MSHEDDDGRYVPLGIERTIRLLRTLDLLYQRMGFASADGPRYEAERRDATRSGGRNSSDLGHDVMEQDSALPDDAGHAPREEDGRRRRHHGLGAEVLYEFLRGEFAQYERLAGLGFRYAESMLDFAERPRHADRAAGVVGRAREVDILAYEPQDQRGTLRLDNPTGRAVELTVSAGGFVSAAGATVHPEVRLPGYNGPIVPLAVGEDRIVNFAIETDLPPGRWVGEIYASGPGIHQVFRVHVQRGPTAPGP